MKFNSEISVENVDGQPLLQQCSVTCRCTALDIRPITLRFANFFILKFHRHHKPVTGAKYAIGIFCKYCNEVCGVAICGRPVARKLDDGLTIEVNRLCVKDGIPNGCSKLYGACSRIAKEMGYKKIVTYILMSESGSSLKASGWNLEATNVGAKAWNSSGNRVRKSEITDLFGTYRKYPVELKQKWSKVLRNGR